jgi:hypothetical protein
MTLENHPMIQGSQLTGLAAHQIVTEVNSGYYPLAYGSLTGAGRRSDTNSASVRLSSSVRQS